MIAGLQAKRVEVTMSAELDDYLEATAFMLDLTKSEFVRAAVRQLLGESKDAFEEQYAILAHTTPALSATEAFSEAYKIVGRWLLTTIDPDM